MAWLRTNFLQFKTTEVLLNLFSNQSFVQIPQY